jgi:hypothetical protein
LFKPLAMVFWALHCKLEDKGLVPNPFNSGGWVHSQCLKKLHRPKASHIT